MAAPLTQQHYTPEEYLAYERQVEYKNEYIAGQIIAMSGGSREHALISGNLLAALKVQLRGQSCETYGSDMRVKVTTRGMYTYPDLTVACNKPQFEDAHGDTLLNPTVIIEVLSPSTERYDRGAKFGYYRALPSLQEYLLVAQDQALVEHFVRAGDDWVLHVADDLTAVVQLPSIGCALPLAEVYDQVRWLADAAATPTESEAGA